MCFKKKRVLVDRNRFYMHFRIIKTQKLLQTVRLINSNVLYQRLRYLN